MADPISAYLQALERGLQRAPRQQRSEWLREIQSHLQDAAAEAEGDMHARAQTAVDRLGPADQLAAGLMAEAVLDDATRGFRPVVLARGLALAYGMGWTAFAVMFSLGYLLLIPVVLLTVGKLINPDAGLWLHPSGGWALSLHGFAGSREVLGWWLPVIGTVISIGGWLVLNRLLRLSMQRVRRQWHKARG